MAKPLSRRAALAGALAAGLLPPLAAAGVPALIINGLGDIDDPNTAPAGQTPAATGRLSRRVRGDLRQSGLSAVTVTLGYVAGPDDPLQATLQGIRDWDRLIAANRQALLKVTRSADILAARDQGKVGIIYGFQNAVQLGDQPDRVDLFAERGLRVLQLTYNPVNALGGGSLAGDIGLTAFGRAVVARANQKRVLVDLAHSGEALCREAAAASTRPVAISHTGCRALTDLPRNKTDAELRLVASLGGVVGIYFMPFLTRGGVAHAADVVAHIRHAVQVCGEDHVAIGTDGTVTATDDIALAGAAARRDALQRRAAGIGAPGEVGADTLLFVPDLQGPQQFLRLAALLTAEGFSPARIDKILGGNWLRLYREVWGV